MAYAFVVCVKINNEERIRMPVSIEIQNDTFTFKSDKWYASLCNIVWNDNS